MNTNFVLPFCLTGIILLLCNGCTPLTNLVGYNSSGDTLMLTYNKKMTHQLEYYNDSIHFNTAVKQDTIFLPPYTGIVMGAGSRKGNHAHIHLLFNSLKVHKNNVPHYTIHPVVDYITITSPYDLNYFYNDNRRKITFSNNRIFIWGENPFLTRRRENKGKDINCYWIF